MAEKNESTKGPVKSRTGFIFAMGLYDRLFFLLSLLLNAVVIYTAYSSFFTTAPATSDPATSLYRCDAPLPNLLSIDPIPIQHPLVVKATEAFEKGLEDIVNESKPDSLAVAIVTPEQSIFEWYYGALRANETHSDPVDRHSGYRIASISKLFTALQTLILRERGALDLDDLASEYIPELAYPLVPRNYIDKVTIRQLLSHMSGLGRDWPPGSGTGHWPHDLAGAGGPPYNNMSFPSLKTFLTALRSNPFLTRPYTLPAYSNTGYNLLGIINTLAEARQADRISPLNYVKLINRDIFQPLGFNDSSFYVTDENKDHVAVSSSMSWETDMDAKIYNPSGGITSSLSDLTTLAQSFLDPSDTGKGLLPSIVMREWLRPLHTEWDGYTAMGMLWEISQITDSFGQIVDVYSKGGDLMSHHSIFTLLPGRSVGIVVLNTGNPQAIPVVNLAIKHFLSAFDTILSARAKEHLEGVWTSEDGKTTLKLDVEKGSLYTSRFVIGNTNVLATLGRPTDVTTKIPIWYMGIDEYRILSYSVAESSSCSGQFGLDSLAYMNNASVTLFRLLKNLDDPALNILRIPSLQLNLTRTNVPSSVYDDRGGKISKILASAQHFFNTIWS